MIGPAPTLFDRDRAAAAGQAAANRAGRNSTARFRHAAAAAVAWCATHHETFTADDVWAQMVDAGGVPSTNDNRALGAVMRWAARDGLIEVTDQVRPSARVSLHGSPRRVWRSMVFAGSGPAEGSVGLDPADDRETG